MIINSYRYAGGAPAPWTPGSLADLVSWYDASDNSTITHVGGSVSQWDDKSGNAYHLSQPTGSAQPSYNSTDEYIEFDGVAEYLNIASRFGLVVNPDIQVCLLLELIATGDNIWMLGDSTSLNLAGGTSGGWSWRFNGGNEVYGGASTSLATQHLVIFERPNGGNFTASKFYFNGAEESATAGGGTGVPTSTDANFDIGRARLSSGNYDYSNLRIHELIINNSTSQTDREKIEGYIAHKWGLTANLPAGHPYKTTAP